MNYLNDKQKNQIINSLKSAEKDAENSSEGAWTGIAAGAGAFYVLLGILSTSGFSAAGLSSGLAALGLGLGMIGGIFVVPALIFGAMLWNINSEKEKKPASCGGVWKKRSAGFMILKFVYRVMKMYFLSSLKRLIYCLMLFRQC